MHLLCILLCCNISQLLVVNDHYSGNYYRRPIAPKHKKKPPELFKLPPAGPAVVPQPFITPPNTVSVAKKAEELVAAGAAGSSSGSSSQQSTWSWRSWWKLNAPLVILNLGSLATLAGFTRTDVIELRSLAITGNTSFVIYSLLRGPPIQWNVLLYQFLFASVNAYNIVVILNEREGKVHLSPRQEEIYTEHFQPHGVSPKQFEKVMKTGQVRIIKKGEVLSRAGQCMSHVKLVVRGNTRANVMGRHLTAMGSMRGNRNLQGGDSGAWIGEMAFLQSLWDKEHSPKVMQKKFSGLKKSNSATDEDNNDTKADASTTNGTIIKSGGSTLTHCGDSEQSYCAISTIVAVEDIELIEWSFEDMETVMKTSRELQDSITRAMTAAIVGKVVNFMVSRQSAMPKFSTLMDNWKSSQRRDKDGDTDEEDEEQGVVHPPPPLATSEQQII